MPSNPRNWTQTAPKHKHFTNYMKPFKNRGVRSYLLRHASHGEESVRRMQIFHWLLSIGSFENKGIRQLTFTVAWAMERRKGWFFSCCWCWGFEFYLKPMFFICSSILWEKVVLNLFFFLTELGKVGNVCKCFKPQVGKVLLFKPHINNIKMG